MSRIGKAPDPRPAGVDVAIDGQKVTVKGPKGTLTHTVAEPITVARARTASSRCRVPTTSASPSSLHGLSRTLIANMVIGVTAGLRARSSRSSASVTASQPRATTWSSRSGSATPCASRRPRASRFTVEARPASRSQGIDKQLVGQVAANIRKLRKPDPYKGKGVRYAGEYSSQGREDG